MEELLIRMNGKAGRLFLMKRAKADVSSPAAFKRDCATDQFDDINRRENLRFMIAAGPWHFPHHPCFSIPHDDRSARVLFV
jgi:hypothetical protein